MFICNKCGQFFEQPLSVQDTVPYGSGYVKTPKYEYCPFCLGDFSEVKLCEICEGYYSNSDFTGVCTECLYDLQVRFSNILQENFSAFEIEAINSIYDGKELK